MKKIEDVAPLLAPCFLDIEYDTDLLKQHERLIAGNAEQLGGYSDYLGRLHDASITKTIITDNSFALTLNDFTTLVFSQVIIDRKGIHLDPTKLIFPIQLEFETNQLNFYKVSTRGTMRPIFPVTITEYLYDQIISVSADKVKIGLVVWKEETEKERGENILIVVDAKKVKLTEHQDTAWNDLFGNQFNEYYQCFRDAFYAGRYLSDQHQCELLVNEFEGMAKK